MTLRSRDKVALGIVAGVLVLVVFYFVAIAPQRSKISSLNASIVSQRQTLAEDKTAYEAGRAAQISLRMNRSQWAALKRAVPATANIPELLRTLQRNANSAHVTMQSITLSGTASAVAETSTSPAAPTSVPVSLSFSGTYQNLEQLLRKLDTLVVESGDHVRASGPLVSLGSVSLTGTAGKLDAALTASIYELAGVSTSDSSVVAP
jgi:Tfp pilus assembly protein PilO